MTDHIKEITKALEIKTVYDDALYSDCLTPPFSSYSIEEIRNIENWLYGVLDTLPNDNLDKRIVLESIFRFTKEMRQI
jgi:hypothetical protein